MEIRIFQDIDDAELVRSWRRLQKEYNYFPQSHYDWCAPWWRILRGKRQLYIVAVKDDEQKIVGIAPCCIERTSGFALLRSFPIHFGDFFTFILDKSGSYRKIAEAIITHLQTFKHWHAVKLDQVNSKDPLYSYLLESGFLNKKMTDIFIADFAGKPINEFMRTLSKNSRKGIMKKVRRIQRDYPVEFIEVSDYTIYLDYFSDLKEVFFRRRGTQKAENKYQCRNIAISSLFDEDQMRLYLLKVNGNLIGYKLGFKHDSCFYSWQVAHDPHYSKYSPGHIITYLIISNSDSSGISRINFMGGGHDYERTWAKSGLVTGNYSMLNPSRSVKGRLIENYFLKLRQHLKTFHNKLKS
jgi:CelD/BcsL family acetyltransferase involved in cellulose biosynthesis